MLHKQAVTGGVGMLRPFLKNLLRKWGGETGIVVVGYGGRGDSNIKFTAMPVILLEPLFASNTNQAEIIRSENGRERLAKVLADSIRQYFPKGGLIAFSVGHKYKTSSPNDRGAAVIGGGNEADFAEMVLIKVQALLTAIVPE
jgi:hypothetical protein